MEIDEETRTGEIEGVGESMLCVEHVAFLLLSIDGLRHAMLRHRTHLSSLSLRTLLVARPSLVHTLFLRNLLPVVAVSRVRNG